MVNGNNNRCHGNYKTILVVKKGGRHIIGGGGERHWDAKRYIIAGLQLFRDAGDARGTAAERSRDRGPGEHLGPRPQLWAPGTWYYPSPITLHCL